MQNVGKNLEISNFERGALQLNTCGGYDVHMHRRGMAHTMALGDRDRDEEVSR